MPTPVTYSLAERDGEVFVACRQTDYNEPRYVTNHYPTGIGAARLLFNLNGEASSLADLTVVCELPGSYRVTHVAGRAVYGYFFTFTLPEGGRTQSAFTTFSDVPRPRVGKGTRLEWSGGAWHKYKPAGGHERIYV